MLTAKQREERDVDIYVLYDKDGLARYVGRSVSLKARLANHRRDKNWLSSYRIVAVANIATWQEAEQFWIALFKRAGHPLENKSKGGEGSTGHSVSQQTRDKIAAKHRGVPESPEAIAKAVKGRAGWKPSAVHRKKIAEANHRRIWTPQSKQKAAQSALQKREQHRQQKYLFWHKRKTEGWVMPPELRAIYAEAQRRSYQSESGLVRLKKLADAARHRIWTIESIEKMSQSRRRWWERKRSQC